MNFLWKAWIRLFELCIILGGLSAALIAGVGIDWMSQYGQPVFLENPVASRSYVQNPLVSSKEGGWVVTTRSLKRVDECSVSAGVWVVKDGKVVFHIDDYTSFARPRGDFFDQDSGFYVQKGLPPGEYAFRTYVLCDRNPIVTAKQQLRDLPFKVVP